MVLLMRNKIKVFIVDDSILFRKTLIDNLSKNDNIEVVGYAVDAFDAQLKIPKLNPDVVTLDVEMPGMNGIDFLKQLIPKHSVPVVLVTSLSINVFEALSAGAVDFVRKPDMQMQSSVSYFLSDLVAKISIAANAKIKPRVATQTVTAASVKGPVIKNTTAGRVNHSLKNSSTVIAIGASTGGTEATLNILKDLPADTPGIVVVQHMPPGFTKMYAERLNRLCQMEVIEAKNGDKVLQGRVLIAPGDAHMKVVKMGTSFTVSCYSGEKVSGHCPSVDVLFNSVAENVRSNAVGIIMTGMGRDGASGLLNMRKNGAYTIGQDKESCVVYGMPMVAYNIGAVTIQASCDNIASVLKRHLNIKP